MTRAESVKREFTERIQFTRNVGKNARMRSQCVPGSLGTRLLYHRLVRAILATFDHKAHKQFLADCIITII